MSHTQENNHPRRQTRPEDLVANTGTSVKTRQQTPGANRPKSAGRASVPSPLSELEQWVSGERLLEILWDERSRPSIQWIRKETKRRMMPHIRRGHLIFYRPRSVMEWFSQRESRPASMKPHFEKGGSIASGCTAVSDDYPDVYDVIPPDGERCKRTGLDRAALCRLLTGTGAWRPFVRVVCVSVPDSSNPEMLFHVGDLMRCLNHLSKAEGSGGRKPE